MADSDAAGASKAVVAGAESGGNTSAPGAASTGVEAMKAQAGEESAEVPPPSSDQNAKELEKMKSLAIIEEEEEDKDRREALKAENVMVSEAESEGSTSARTAAPTVVEERRAMANEEPDGEEESAEVSPPSFDQKAEELEKMKSLAIREEEDEEEKDRMEGLKEPEDSAIKAVTVGDTVYTSAVSFEDLNLSKELLQGLYVEMRFKRPSKIQAVTLPMILTPPCRNLVAQAQSGSGKTTCFVLGMLSRVDPKKKAPQALCICPTRELAQQNEAVLLKMGAYTDITSMCVIPSDSAHYIPVMRRPPVTEQIVIGTPGTIKKWISAKRLSLREMKILVFDEADHMLAEVLLFSATFNDTVKAFVSRVVKDANQLYVKKEELTLDMVKQYKVHCPDELAKIEVIKDKIFEFGEKVGQTIIFVKTRQSASMLHGSLLSEGYECTSIQGAIEQADRDKIIKEFKDGLTKVLITTDLLARGFDQAQVNLVVNYGLPVKHDSPFEPDYELYLHRVGRAGRFGRKGAVFNLLCPDREHMIMEKIEQHFALHVSEVPDWRSEEDFKTALSTAGLL